MRGSVVMYSKVSALKTLEIKREESRLDDALSDSTRFSLIYLEMFFKRFFNILFSKF